MTFIQSLCPSIPYDRNGSKADIGWPKIFLSYRTSSVLASHFFRREYALLQLARTRRPSRSGEWTEAKAVTFIVTLAATRSVTLAAGRAGMSRKSAYALKHRDARFAAAWKAALAASALKGRDGDKVDEVYKVRVRPLQGNNSARCKGRLFPGNARSDSFESLWSATVESACPSLARLRALP